MTPAAQSAIALTPARGPGRLVQVALRYGLSTSGPVAVSGAHFLAALILLRALAAGEFGLFSFVLVIVPFGMSVSGALLVIPVSASLKARGQADSAVADICLKLNLLFAACVGVCVGGMLLMSRAEPAAAALFGLFGAALTYRWFARCFAYVNGRIGAAVASDLVYATAAVAGLLLLVVIGDVTLDGAAAALLLAALAALLPFGREFFRAQRRALSHARVAGYRGLWRDLTRWSLLGVIFTEMTVNAHAYLVTFLSGPKAFALLAVGMLLMRPASLVQSALPDMERPIMTRAIAAHDYAGLMRTVREFRYGLGAVWVGTVALAAVLLHWFPQIVLKKGYDPHEVAIVAVICAIITAARALRAPLAVWLQAAGEFKALAEIGTWSSAISVGTTLLLLLAFGPVASLGGILIGEIIILARLHRLIDAWRRNHG